MKELEPRDRIAEAELNILRALCQGTPEGSLWAEARQILGNYRFRNPAHQVVFDALSELPRHAPALLGGLLPGLLTRRGFPDADLGPYFQPHRLHAGQVVELMKMVSAATPPGK